MSSNYTLDFSQKLPESAQMGMKKAKGNCDPQLWARAYEAIVSLARRVRELQADDVLSEMELDPDCPDVRDFNALGPVMQQARANGVISWTDRMVRSKRDKKHGNLRRLWLSNYYQSSE